EARGSGAKLVPVAGAVEIEEGELEVSGFRRGPAKRVALIFIAEKNGAVARDPLLEGDGLRAFDSDRFAIEMRLFEPSLKRVMTVAGIDLLAIEILDVELKIRHSPGDALVVANDDRGDARERDAGDVEVAAAKMHHVPGRGNGEFEM